MCGQRFETRENLGRPDASHRREAGERQRLRSDGAEGGGVPNALDGEHERGADRCGDVLVKVPDEELYRPQPTAITRGGEAQHEPETVPIRIGLGPEEANPEVLTDWRGEHPPRERRCLGRGRLVPPCSIERRGEDDVFRFVVDDVRRVADGARLRMEELVLAKLELERVGVHETRAHRPPSPPTTRRPLASAISSAVIVAVAVCFAGRAAAFLAAGDGLARR